MRVRASIELDWIGLVIGGGIKPDGQEGEDEGFGDSSQALFRFAYNLIFKSLEVCGLMMECNSR